MNDKTHMLLSKREFASVLAALRHWQRLDCMTEGLKELFDTKITPLKPMEVDMLCERLNTEESNGRKQ